MTVYQHALIALIKVRLIANDDTPRKRWWRLIRISNQLRKLHNLFGTWYANGSLTLAQWNKIPVELQVLIPWNYQNPITLKQAHKAQKQIKEIIKLVLHKAWLESELCNIGSIDPDEVTIKRLSEPASNPDPYADDKNTVKTSAKTDSTVDGDYEVDYGEDI